PGRGGAGRPVRRRGPPAEHRRHCRPGGGHRTVGAILVRGGGGGRRVMTPPREVALVDLLDRLLTGGAVLAGDFVLAIADIDLVHISLRALITAITDEGDQP